MSGKHIELFLVDGTPGGLTTAEILNWTGIVFSAPRSLTGALVSRRELAGTCVYLLLGEDERAVGSVRCYIGETDDFAARLRQHTAKEFWDRVVVVTSKDANLTKAHGRYLEARLIGLAKQAGRVVLDNGTEPPLPGLPEAHASDMDYFISQLQIVLPVLGIDAIRVLEPREPAAGRGADLVSPVFRLRNVKLRVDARARQVDGEFTMLAGSQVVAKWHGKGRAPSTIRSYQGYRDKHEALLADGSISVADGIGVLTKDLVFGSPSTAGAVAQGSSCNGRISWISDSGEMFGEWENRGMAMDRPPR